MRGDQFADRCRQPQRVPDFRRRPGALADRLKIGTGRAGLQQQPPAARQGFTGDEQHVAGELLPGEVELAHRLAVFDDDVAALEQRLDQRVRRLAAARAVAKPNANR